jgi:hypothetical protein
MGIVYPSFPVRALFFSTLFIILFIIRFLTLDEYISIKHIAITISIPFLLLSINDTLRDAKKLHNEYAKREFSIESQIETESKKIEIKKIERLENNKLMNDPLAPPPNKNYWASRFYGVDSIEIIEE